MRNKKHFVRTTKKCMIAIMSAMFVMTPAGASVVAPIGSYAETLPNNPAGVVIERINENDTMEYNYGTVMINFGTIEYNIGDVYENAGTVNDNWGEVNNSDAADKANLVVNNHVPGEVTGGNVTNNWGTLEGTVNVTNDNLTNDPHPTAPFIVEVEPIVFDPEPDDSAQTEVENPAQNDSSVVSVGGVSLVKTQLAGAYDFSNAGGISGIAVRQSAETIRMNYGIDGTPFVRVYGISREKSPAAYACIDGMAASCGAEVLGAVNIDFGYMRSGHFSNLPNNVTTPTTISVDNAGGRELGVVIVLPGGSTQVIWDDDDDPDTVTFNIVGGLVAYAIIAR